MDVIHVQPTDDFRLWLVFADGQQKEFDMAPMLTQKPWNKVAAPALFKQARVDYGTVVWPGEIDIAPETLLLDSVAR